MRSRAKRRHTTGSQSGKAIGWSTESSIGLASALSVPLGRYRLSVTGTSQGKSYRVSSQPFSVVADDAIKPSPRRTGSKLTGQAAYPVGDGFRLLRMSGRARQRCRRGQPESHDQNGSKSETLTVSTTDGGFSLDTTLDVSAGVQLDVEDAAGNRAPSASASWLVDPAHTRSADVRERSAERRPDRRSADGS